MTECSDFGDLCTFSRTSISNRSVCCVKVPVVLDQKLIFGQSWAVYWSNTVVKNAKMLTPLFLTEHLFSSPPAWKCSCLTLLAMCSFLLIYNPQKPKRDGLNNIVLTQRVPFEQPSFTYDPVIDFSATTSLCWLLDSSLLLSLYHCCHEK